MSIQHSLDAIARRLDELCVTAAGEAVIGEEKIPILVVNRQEADAWIMELRAIAETFRLASAFGRVYTTQPTPDA